MWPGQLYVLPTVNDGSCSDAEKSAGPYVSVSNRSLAKAISSARMSPSASSICASMPIVRSSPSVSSSWRSARSTNATSPALRTFGTMMQSTMSPASLTTSRRSSKANCDVTWLMRTTRVLPCQSWLRSASTTLVRAAGFSEGAHASSRSRKTSSAALSAAFSIIRWLLPGTARTERRRRAGIASPSASSRPGRLVRVVLGPRGAVVGWDVPVLRRPGEAFAREETAQHALQVLRPAQVVLHAFEEPRHQLLELRVLRQLFLEASELCHQVLDRHLLGDLHEHRLRGGGRHHLHLLADHLEPSTGDARALVLTPAELCLELVELGVQLAQIHAGWVVAHSLILGFSPVTPARCCPGS